MPEEETVFETVPPSASFNLRRRSTHAVASGKPPPFFARRANSASVSASVASGPQSSGGGGHLPTTTSRRRRWRPPTDAAGESPRSAPRAPSPPRPPAPPACSTPRDGWAPGDEPGLTGRRDKPGVYSDRSDRSRRRRLKDLVDQLKDRLNDPRLHPSDPGADAARHEFRCPSPPCPPPRRRGPPGPSTPWSAASTRSNPPFRPSRRRSARRRRRAVNDATGPRRRSPSRRRTPFLGQPTRGPSRLLAAGVDPTNLLRKVQNSFPGALPSGAASVRRPRTTLGSI